MSNPHFVLLYVESPAASAEFYRKLLDREPIEASPTFVMFALREGLMLGLWARAGVRPPDSAPAGGGDISFPANDAAEVDAAHARWKGLGVSILLPPTDMDFGRTFVARDPDGHRLRVFAPAGA